MAPRLRQLGSDLALALGVALLAVVDAVGLATPRHPSPSSGLIGVALALAASLPLVARRRFPVTVLVVVEAVTIARISLSGALVHAGVVGDGVLALMVAVFTVGTRLPRKQSLALTVSVVAVNGIAFTAVAVFGPPGASIYSGLLSAVALIGAWALGDNLETRRAYLAALVERAAHLERDQEERARVAVAGERTRIAREVHDVVAHHVSAIAVQAGAAEEIAERDPARARRALSAIQATSRQALVEMRAIVGILRDSEDGQALAPQPTLAQVERLVEQTRAAGLRVEVLCRGDRRPLPEAMDLSAYRIVQEALTNTLKHGRATRAMVAIDYGPSALEIVVSNDGATPNAEVQSGRGLVGMRERVGLFRGSLEVGPSADGEFRVHARLPLQDDGR
ncbi:MAG: sensor histidine kinase [Candidatus Dormibacteraeota bacterium]|nr:sensor histidine kinase [Candidatus Dormibacteraeota bacterium]